MTYPQFQYGFYQRLPEWSDKEKEAQKRTEELHLRMNSSASEPVDGGELIAEPEPSPAEQKALPKPE